MHRLPAINQDCFHIFSQLDFEKTLVGKLAYLDFAIEVICRELEAENTALFVRRGITDDIDNTQFWIPSNGGEVRKNVPLSGFRVISRPWDSDRLLHAVVSEFISGHRRHENRTDAILYEELNLVVINNGRHHQTVAKLKDRAFVDELKIIRSENYYANLSMDGEYWKYNNDDGRLEKTICPDYRMALLFALANKRRELVQGHDFSEWEHVAEMTEDKVCDDGPRYCALLVEKNDEINMLRKENELLTGHVNRLRKKLKDAGLSDNVLT